MNSDKRIVYINEEGGVSVITPADKETRTVEEIAAKDVPTGLKYKIIDVADLPASRNFRDAWTVSESDLTYGEGA